MIHEHHEWLADVKNQSWIRTNVSKRWRALGTYTGDWTRRRVSLGRCTTEWLPPQYQIEKRKYMLLENEDGTALLRKLTSLSFTLTIRKSFARKAMCLPRAWRLASASNAQSTAAIKEAYEEAITLRSGMQIRDATKVKDYLVPPVFFGLLGESHDWKDPGSNPKENIKSITTEFDRDLVKFSTRRT